MDPKPVFVSPSGRRRPVLRWSGITLAILLAGYLFAVGIALITTVDTPRAQLPRQPVPGDGERGERHKGSRADGTAW
jgi:hypothetical protein